MTALDKLRAKLKRLGEAFAQELPRRVRELEDAVLKARDDGRAQDALTQARATAHQMKGTAGTFGFAEVSAKASAIEATAEEMLHEAELTPGDPRWASIEARLKSLRRLASEATGSHGDPS